MKEMYKDNAGNWHYGYKGEKLSEVSYSTNSVPNSIPIEWIKKFRNQFEPGDDDYKLIDGLLNIWRIENGSN